MLSKTLVYCLTIFSVIGCKTEQEKIRLDSLENRDEYGCHRQDPNYHSCREKGIYFSDMCFNSSVLLATTTGSPSGYSCNNKHHKMRVEPVTKAGEEIGSLVFCECVK